MRPLLPAYAALTLSACASTPAGQTAAVKLSLPTSTFVVGNTLAYTATVGPADGFLYLYALDASGTVQLLPNRATSLDPGAVHVHAGQVVTVPPAGARFSLTFDAAGPVRLLAFLSARPLNLDGISAYESTSDRFATSKLSSLEELSMALKQAADQVPGNVVAEDRVTFTVSAP